MRDSKEKLKILQKLKDQGFVRDEDFESKLKELINEIEEVDLVMIRQDHIWRKEENERKENQINYFTMLLSEQPDLKQIIWKNFLIG